MASRLKIYACSGVGGTVKLPHVTFDNYGVKTIDNTQAVNTILIRMNSCRVRLDNRTMSDSEREELQAQLNVYRDCLDAARGFAGDNARLAKAGEAIKRKWGLGNDFTEWWQNVILPRNKYGLETEQRGTIQKSIKRVQGIRGIGELDWRDNEELTEYLTKGSEYFLYLYFTEEQLRRLPVAFRIKRSKQMQTYNYCKALFIDIYGSEDEMRSVISDGIMQYFKGATPEEICERIAQGENVISGAEPLTWTIEAIVAVVSACLSFLAGVIVAICQAVSNSNKAKYAAVNQKTIEESVPNPDDWSGLSIPKTKAGISWLPLVAIGAGLLIFGKKF